MHYYPIVFRNRGFKHEQDRVQLAFMNHDGSIVSRREATLRLGQFQTPICFAGWIAVDRRPDCTSVVGCQIIREQPHAEFFLKQVSR
jgi:hypothetical protein